jgi:glycosyltransferase involved in cell wall biosynthesis
MENLLNPTSLLQQRSDLVGRSDNVSSPHSVATRTFMLFAPWCDQGLGYQAHAYVHWLRAMDFSVCIFACAPSKRSGRTAPPNMQADATEWVIEGVDIFHCNVNRESVPPEVVLQYAREQHVTDAMMLEVCHRNIFTLASALHRAAGIRIYAVPNIEMVRRTELDIFVATPWTAILCPNQHAVEIMTYFLIKQRSEKRRPATTSRIEQLPTRLPEDASTPRATIYNGQGPVRFLLVGGMNAEKRKRATLVVEAFTRALGGRNTVAHLTVLAQGDDLSPKLRPTPSSKQPGLTTVGPRLPTNVSIVHRHLSYADIQQFYATHHVLVMVSRAEGLGLAFYEAMRHGLATITLNSPMYREIVLNGQTGWYLKAEWEADLSGARAIGNPDSIVQTYSFNGRDLLELFKVVAQSGSAVAACQKGARAMYDTAFSPERVIQAWSQALAVSV